MVELNTDNGGKNENKKGFEEASDNNPRTSVKKGRSVSKSDNNPAGDKVSQVTANNSNSFPPRKMVIEPHAKNFTGWEVISVELSAHRDIIPRIRHEIRSYTITECQFVRELEKKLPSSGSSGEVRLHLVMEQIERLRLHRRSALDELSRSTVRIAELESKKERASFEAGELYWNTRLNELENRYYATLSSPAPVGMGSSLGAASFQSEEAPPRRYAPPRHTIIPHSIERDGSFGSGRDQHEFARTINEERKDTDYENRGTTQASTAGSAALVDSVETNNSETKNESQHTNPSLPIRNHESAGSQSSVPMGVANNELKSSSESLPSNTDSFNTLNAAGEKAQLVKTETGLNPPSAEAAMSYLGELLKAKAGDTGQEPSGTKEPASKTSHSNNEPSEIETIIKEAHDQISSDRSKLKRLLPMSAIPAATLIGLILLEMQTHILSNLLSNFAR